MKFTASTKTLLAALNAMKSIVKPSRTHAILGSIWLSCDGKCLTLTGMDLEKRKSLAVPCRSIREGAIALKFAPLHAYLSTRPEPDCEISVDGLNATICCGKSINRMPGLHPDEFPKWPEAVHSVEFAIPAELLSECLTKSLAQAATDAEITDSTRGFMIAVMFVSRNGMLNIQATNGKRLIIFYTEIPFAPDAQCIIPRESVSSLAALAATGEIELRIGDNVLMASAADASFTTKLIDARLQDFEKVFPPAEKMTTRIIIERERLLSEISNAETQLAPDMRSIALESTTTELVIRSNGQDIGNVENRMELKDGSDAIEFAVNPQYLKDALNAFDEEEITLRFMDAVSPFLIRTENCVSVVYPQRLKPSNEP